ncbi:serine protease FAM111A-like [Pseudophryne corroboree]|uniref:serine protease FAM111A-like n=1 Tax=Pseudophryne corroboree TaxID=495146 RepID=UPI003081E677
MESGSAQKQIVATEQFTLSFKWGGKTGSKYMEIRAEPYESIFDALKKSNHFTNHYKNSSYLIVFGNNCNAEINPSAPCGPLGKDETLDLKQIYIKKKDKKPPETSAYPKRSGGLFFKVNKKGKTPLGGAKIILHYNKLDLDDNAALAVFGYEDETIEHALKHDKRFKNFTVLRLEGTKTKVHEPSLTLSVLEDDTYTICVAGNNKDVGKHKNVGSHDDGSESNPIVPTNPPSDDPGDFMSTEAYIKMAERVKNIVNVYVQNNGPGNAWRLIKEDYSQNTEKAVLYASTMRILTRPLDSVAMILITEGGNMRQGTCMALIDNLFLTCCHVVESLLTKTGDCKARIIFVYESPDKQVDVGNSKYEFSIKILAHSVENDYALFSVAEFSPVEGLLQYLALPPERGTAAIIGHPGGQCKQIDLCSVINFHDRTEAIQKTIVKESSDFHLMRLPKWSEMEDRRLVTYNTRLYEGASGAPVFDECGNLVAMHSAGFSVPSPLRKLRVIECGRSIVDIVIYGAVAIPVLRQAFKEIVTNKPSLKDYIYKVTHPVHMQPIIRKLKRLWENDPDFSDNGLENSPMDTSDTVVGNDSPYNTEIQKDTFI